MNAYKAINKEAKRLGFPERYKTDLTFHDKKVLSWFKGCFGWFLRKGGTHLQLVDPSADIRECQYLNGYRGNGGWTYSSIFGDVVAVYFWDGFKLSKLDNEKQLKELIKKAWKQG